MHPHELEPELYLDRLAVWEGLGVEARRAFVEVDDDAFLGPRSFGADAPAMLEEGLLASAPVDRVRIADAARPLHAVLRAAAWCPVLDAADDDEAPLRAWIRESYDAQEQRALLTESPGPLSDAGYHLARLAASRLWVNDLLDADPVAWERERLELPWGMGRRWKPLLDARTHRELAGVVAALREAKGPVAMTALFDGLAGGARHRRARAVQAGLRYLALFLRLDDPPGRLELGLTPRALRHRHAQANPAPETRDVALDAAPAFLIADMTTVLLDAATGEMRIKASGRELYQKTVDRLLDALVPVPPLVERWAETGAPERLNAAIGCLLVLQLLEEEEDDRARRRFRATVAGRQWLACPPHEQGRRVADFVLGVDGDAVDAAAARRPVRRSPRLAPGTRRSALVTSGVDDDALFAAVRATLATLPTQGAVSLGAWLRHHTRVKNPFNGTGVGGHRFEARGRMQPFTPEELEKGWQDVLASSLAHRLIPLGGLALAEGGDDARDVHAGLTPVGGYLAGLADTIEAPSASRSAPRIIVQPNFDVVFLDPAPDVEAELAPFAERVGRHVGTLFHLAREAALRAAGAGMTHREAHRRLEHAQGGPLPDNVARSLEGWFSRVQHVEAAAVVILRCPDEETASRVESAGGADAERLGPLTVALPDKASVRRLRTKLRTQGIFVERA